MFWNHKNYVNFLSCGNPKPKWDKFCQPVHLLSPVHCILRISAVIQILTFPVTAEESFVSKFAAAAAAMLCLILFSLPSSAQIIARGNLYIGGAWGRSDFIRDGDNYKGWNASVEAIPFPRYSFIGLVFDASGLYRPGITQYNLLGGPRLSI